MPTNRTAVPEAQQVFFPSSVKQRADFVEKRRASVLDVRLISVAYLVILYRFLSGRGDMMCMRAHEVEVQKPKTTSVSRFPKNAAQLLCVQPCNPGFAVLRLLYIDASALV